MSVLLLAGTTEARALAELLAGRDIAATASLAGATAAPARLALPTRIGGFGGAKGLASWLGENGIQAVIDGTHPYAANMQSNASRACAETGVPRLRLLRPAWPDQEGWVVVGSIAEAAAALPPGAHAYLTTGRKEIVPFLARDDCRFVLRSIDPAHDLPSHVTPVRLRAPMAEPDEMALIRRYDGLTHMVTKNSGGPMFAKLDAAERAGLQTIIVRRPPVPPGPVAETPQAALEWLEKISGVAR